MPKKTSRVPLETVAVLCKVAEAVSRRGSASTGDLSDAGVARSPLESARRAGLLCGGGTWALTDRGREVVERHQAQLAALRLRGPTIEAEQLVRLCRSFVTFTKAAAIIGADRLDRLTAEAAIYVDPATRELVVAGQDGSEVRLPAITDLCSHPYARAALADFLRGPG